MPPSWVTYHPALNRWVQRERTQTAAPKRDSSSGRRRRPDELSIKSAFGQNGVQANFLCCTTSPLREVKMRTSQEMFAQPRIAANRRDGWEILSRDCLSMALPRGVLYLKKGGAQPQVRRRPFPGARARARARPRNAPDGVSTHTPRPQKVCSRPGSACSPHELRRCRERFGSISSVMAAAGADTDRRTAQPINGRLRAAPHGEPATRAGV